MRNDRSNNKFGGRRFGGRSERPEMFQATCSDCGQPCEVPFRPTGDRPVLCNQCFGGKRDSRPSRDRDSRPGRSRDDRRPEMHEAICATCGKSCEVPFRPTGDKPVYCSDCFGKGGKSNAGPRTDNSKEQFNSLNAKLDKIIRFLMPAELKETEVKKPVEKKEKKVVAKKEIVKIEKKDKEKAKEKKVTKKKVVSKKKK